MMKKENERDGIKKLRHGFWVLGLGGKIPSLDVSRPIKELEELLRKARQRPPSPARNAPTRTAQAHLTEKNAKTHADIQRARAWMQHTQTGVR